MFKFTMKTIFIAQLFACLENAVVVRFVATTIFALTFLSLFIGLEKLLPGTVGVSS